MRLPILIPILALIALSSQAQDTRTVTQPTLPPVCTTLRAMRHAINSTADTPPGPTYFLRAEDDISPDTAVIQSAIDHCPAGQAVELTHGSGNAFLSGAIHLNEGVTLLIDSGITLYASRDPKDYDPNPADTTTPLLCGTLSDVPTNFDPTKSAATAPKGRPCSAFITINAKHAAIMTPNDGRGEGVIDGRGYAQLIGHTYSWWQMARAAEPKQLRYYSVRLISANHADGFILYNVTLHNAMNYHVTVSNTDGFTAWGVHLQTPTTRGPHGEPGIDARNTDGIDPGSSTNITIAHSWIDNGDDNIAIKTGVTHMSVLDNHFYTGHGMSIGSETNTGDSFLLVDGLTEDHTTSGIRIKSNAARGGLVHDLTYRNICMRNVAVPIAISPYYNNQTIEGFTDPNIPGTRIPDYKSIHLENIFDESPGDVLIAGKDAAHVTQISLEDVIIRGITPAQVHLNYDDITVTKPWTNIPIEAASKGNSTVHLTQDAHYGNGAAVINNYEGNSTCADKFQPMQ